MNLDGYHAEEGWYDDEPTDFGAWFYAQRSPPSWLEIAHAEAERWSELLSRLAQND